MTDENQSRTRGPDRRQHDQRHGPNADYQGPDRRIADRRQQDRRAPAR